MLFELIATICVGFGAAGCLLLAGRLTRGRLPRWTVPAAAGLGMIAFSVWSEYSWFERTEAGLPDSVAVVAMHESRAPWRPWTYVVPQVSGFAAVDRGALRRNAEVPGQVLTEVFIVERWAPVRKVPVLLDCPGHRRADIVDGARFAANGAVEDADWIALDDDDRLMGAVCAEG